jgi:SAM-dependent methyltransferase
MFRISLKLTVDIRWPQDTTGRLYTLGIYDAEFYADMEISSVTSAKEIVPMLLNLYHPDSIVDFGCGTGAFAVEFLQNGIKDVIGYEGDWMRTAKTLLQKDRFIYVDFKDEIKPSRKYDMCLCLEVAEHIDHSSARTLISSLTALSQRIVFSAAIPHQGGNHHINEQWPEYWAHLFAEKGYILAWDPRISIWNNSKIASCYRQNLLVFEKSSESEINVPLSLVHPEAWNLGMKYRKVPIWLRALQLLPRPLLRLGKRVFLRTVGSLK